MVFEARSIVNGTNIREFVGKNVSIFIQVQEMNSGSNIIMGKSSDNKLFTIKYPSDCSISARALDWIEVIGVPASGDSIRAKEVIQFEGGEEFDVESNNMAVQYFAHCKDFYYTQA